MSESCQRRAAILCCSAAVCFCLVAALGAHQANESASRPNDTAAAQSDDFKITVGVNSVLVPVVVRDAHGRAVGDLTQKDFALLDQDKPVAIAGFSVQKRATGAETVPDAERSANAAAPNAPPASTNAAPRAAQPTATPERFVVFLFDDLHFDPGDL